MQPYPTQRKRLGVPVGPPAEADGSDYRECLPGPRERRIRRRPPEYRIPPGNVLQRLVLSKIKPEFLPALI